MLHRSSVAHARTHGNGDLGCDEVDDWQLFTHYLDDIMHTPEGLKWWYLRAIGQIAERANVMTCNIEGLGWGEVDFPADLDRVIKLVEDWT